MNRTYTTNRLRLRILSDEEAQTVLDFYQRNHDFLAPVEPARHAAFYTLDFQRRNLAYEYNAFLKRSYLRFWLFLKEEPEKTIGTVCFTNFLKGPFCHCTLGYKIDRDYCGQGYMKEALSCLLPLVTEEYGFHRVEAYVMPSNTPSIHLLQALQFQQEGLIRDYAMIQNRWQNHLLFSRISQ